MVCGKNAVALIKKGIFAVNKPANVTSADLLNNLRDIIYEGFPTDEKPGFLRLGHGGTLDKSAVGVLIVGVNWGCKKLPLLLHGTKNYVVVGQLGIATDTYSDVGRVINERPYGHVTEPDIANALKPFVGKIWQAAPIYSALKVGGRRMSEFVKEGFEVQPKMRKVRCYSAECTDYSPPFFTLHVRCGCGFYVRSLVNDVGLALNSCAHIRQLQRTQQGPFTLHECLTEHEWTLDRILDSMLLCEFKYSQYEQQQLMLKSQRA